MTPRVVGLALVLSLSFLMVFPGTFSPVRAVNQGGPTRFSPFGPFTQQMLIHFYGDFDPMFTAFQQGAIDISDWQLQSQSAINTFCGNADFFCTSPTSELGLFYLGINSFPSFMGIPLRQSRTMTPASFTITSTASGCSVGFGSLTIALRNQETGAAILDSLNALTATNQPSNSPSVIISDMGGSTPTGIYVLPCVLAGNYRIVSSVYNATTSTGPLIVTITGATATRGTLNVNWNSASNAEPTQARFLIGAALTHLVDDPAFVQTTMTGIGGAPCGFFTTVQGERCPTGTTSEYTCQTVPASCPASNPSGGPPTENDLAECQFNNHPWLNVVGCSTGATGHDVGPYHITDAVVNMNSRFWNTGVQGLVAGYASQDDIRAACDDLVSMGISITGGTCIDLATTSTLATDPGPYAHLVATDVIKAFIRISFGRQQFGQIIADALNFVFGTPQNRINSGAISSGTVCYDPRPAAFPPLGAGGVCTKFTPGYFTFTGATPYVFDDTIRSGGNPLNWQLYTAAQGFDPTPDQFFINRNSINTGGVCAGPTAIKPNNNEMWCDPQTDTDGSAGELVAPTLGLSNQFFQRELIDEVNKAVQVPGFVFTDIFAENNGWNFQQCTTTCLPTQSSIVNTLGFGTQAGAAYFSLLNARQVPGYNPCSVTGAPANCASFAPGGGNPNLIRRGFSQDTSNLSPFTFNSIWEGDFLTDVYDTMLIANPQTAGGSSQFIDWGTTGHSDSFNPNEVGCNSINGCVTGVTTQIWHLRNDWKFSDGNDVKATDVAYTIIANRDVPSSLQQSFVLAVVSAAGLDCGPGQPCKTLQVKLQGQSSLFDFNIGATQLVIEKSLWVSFCGDPPVAGGVCASPTFDPMYPNANSPGIEIGAGPWACIAPVSGTGVSAGHIGGPCAQTSTGGPLTGSTITIGGTITLSENTNFMRCCPNGPSKFSSSLFKLSYADHNNDGVVNILDLADVASKVGTPDPYWCNIGCMNGVVGVTNLATVAIYFGHGITTPFTPSTLSLVDPQIDPFYCNPDGSPAPPGTIPCA